MKRLAACLAVLVSGCTYEPKVVTAWPGMSATQFNHLNAQSGSSLRELEPDWIGINSPVTFLLKYRDQEIRFNGTRRSGGIQISTQTDYTSQDEPASRPYIGTIAFNIGGSMESVAEYASDIQEYRDQLADMAGSDGQLIPTPEDIAAHFHKSSSNLPKIELCSGGSGQFAFALTASHYKNHDVNGGDFRFAFFDGSVGKVIGFDAEQGL